MELDVLLVSDSLSDGPSWQFANVGAFAAVSGNGKTKSGRVPTTNIAPVPRSAVSGGSIRNLRSTMAWPAGLAGP